MQTRERVRQREPRLVPMINPPPADLQGRFLSRSRPSFRNSALMDSIRSVRSQGAGYSDGAASGSLTQTSWYHHKALEAPTNQPYLTTTTHFHSDPAARESRVLDPRSPYNSGALATRHMGGLPQHYPLKCGTQGGSLGPHYSTGPPFTTAGIDMQAPHFVVDPSVRPMTHTMTNSLRRASTITGWQSEYMGKYEEKSPLQYRGYSTLTRK